MPNRLIAISVFIFLFSIASQSQNLPANFQDSLVSGGWTQAEGFTFDATGQMYVWEKDGYVWVVDTNGVKIPTPLLNIQQEVGSWRDHGLNGFALDPNFRTNGYYYCFYTVDRNHLIYFGTGSYVATADSFFKATIARVTRYQANAATNFTTTVAGSRFILIGETKKTGIPNLYESHTGGQLVFGDDGTLLVSTGDGASFAAYDTGSIAHTYYVQALADSIITTKENVGAFRSQMVDCLNGKILRIDPSTGNGVSSNPYYDGANPRAAKSRVWALGLRNPFRMCKRPNTGNTDPTAGDPGTLYIGDVGFETFEDINVCNAPNMNFGWPNYEGLEPVSYYNNATTKNMDAPNPLFGVGGCTRQHLYFRELIKQPTKNGVVPFPITSCNGQSGNVPASVPHWAHARPTIDYKHGLVQARTGFWSGNNASSIDIGSGGSPISGSGFEGYCAIAGVWYNGTAYPAAYQNKYFHADFSGNWIKYFNYNALDTPTAVTSFTDSIPSIVCMAINPKDQFIWYIKYPDQIRKIKYSVSINNFPTAVATQNIVYGVSPLAANFTGSLSTDPENQPLTYLWHFGDGTSTSTLQNPSHTFTAPSGVPTTYTVTLTVTDNVLQSNSTTLKVFVNNTPPQITITSPLNNSYYTMASNSYVMCTANVTDLEHSQAQLTYQWQTILHHNTHNHPEPVDNNVVTATTLSPVGCDGDTYYYEEKLTVTDGAGLSSTASSFIYPACTAPVAAFTANNTSICTGTSINFTDQSSSLTDIYSWTFAGGTPSSSSIKNPVVSYNTPGTYSVTLTVSNIWGNNTLTKTGYITVGSTPSISVNASPTAICSGQSSTLTATGAQNYSWSPANGLNTTTGAAVIATPSSTTIYTVTATNPGCANPATANITVTVAPLNPAVTPIGPITICEGSASTLSATTGSGYTYQWKLNGTNISGATGSTYTLSTNGNYSCFVNAGICSGTSNVVAITKINNPNPTITYLTPLTFCSPGSVAFTANTFSGVTYQWQKNSIDISGATSQTYTATTTGKYRVKETASGCTKQAQDIQVNVNATSVAAAISANGPVTFCSGGSVILNVDNPTPGYSFQWKNNGTSISGATTTSYTATSAGVYTCTVSASCGITTSNSITVSTSGIAALVSPSGTITICSGAVAALSANTGTGYNHQWKLNGANIAGATSSLYNTSVAGNYTVAITSPCGNATSATTTVVIAPLTATSSPAGITICEGQAATFTANSGYNFTYQWLRNGAAISGATVSTFATSQAANYAVRITQSGTCTATSSQSTLNVINNPKPTITAGGTTTFCIGQNVTLTANTFTGVVYQWQKNSANISGATQQNYVASTTGQYRVVETANGCTKIATPVQVTVNCREVGNTNDENELKVIPNPFTSEFTVYGLAFKQGDRLELYDVLGKPILKSSITIPTLAYKVQVANIPNGIYFMQVTTSHTRKTVKMIKD